MNKRDRQIQNKAATVANQDSYDVRETDIDSLESLRDACGLKMKELDGLLGETNNWYSNHQRAGGTHEFSRPDYFRIRDTLEVEFLRAGADFSKNEVSSSLNNSSGWYETRLSEGFYINEYNEVVVFLVTAAILRNEYDALEDEILEMIVDLGIVGEELIEDLRASYYIDYGH